MPLLVLTNLVVLDQDILAGEVQALLAHPKQIPYIVPSNVAYLGDLVAVEVEVANLVQCNVAFWGHVLAMAVEKYTLPFCCPQHFLAMLASRQTMAQCQKHPAVFGGVFGDHSWDFAGPIPLLFLALGTSFLASGGSSGICFAFEPLAELPRCD